MNNITRLKVPFKKQPRHYKLPLVYYNTFPMFEVSLILHCANQDDDIDCYLD